MRFTLNQLAALTGGELCGDGSLSITGAATLSTARPGEITFADSPKRAEKLALSQASAVVVPRGFSPPGLPYVVVENVHAAFQQIVLQFRPERPRRSVGISPWAAICASATLAEGVEIHPYVAIGDGCRIGPGVVLHAGVKLLDGVTIGAGSVLYPNVVCYENTIIGQRVIIHAGAVLGAYGFGYVTQADGTHKRSSQLGYVELEDDVELGAGVTVDRGSYGPTRIGAGTKIDNLVQVGHNCQIGPRNLICSQSGFAGSSSTGENVVMAGQVGVRDHVHIGDKAILGGKAGVMTDLAPNQRYMGSPCTEEREYFRSVAIFQRLPELRAQLMEMQRGMARLEAELAAPTSNEPTQRTSAAA
jgi:UDP-3-O-[3-hydroxymyristoyl] glucosamine N-acyltransferase